MSSRGELLENVAAQGLARVLAIGANTVLILVVARVMGAAGFGGFSYVLAFTAIAVVGADLGTTAVLARGLAQVSGDERAAYLGNFILMRVALVVAASIGAVAAAFAWPRDQFIALLLVAAGLPFLSSRFFEPIYQVYGRPWLSLWSNLALAAAQLLLAVLVWARPGMSVMELTAGFLAGNVVYTGVAAAMMLRLVRPRLKPRRRLFGPIIAMAAPLGVSSVFTTIVYRADVLILGHLRGVVEVGQYSAAGRFLDLAVFASITVITPLIPILSRDILQERHRALERCRTLVQLAGVCSLPVAIAMPTLAPSLIGIVFGPAYLAATDAMTILSWNFVLIVLTLIGSSVNIAIGEVKHGYWNAAVAAGVNLGLNFWLIPRYGMTGAAWAALGGQLSMMLVSHYYTFSRFGVIYAARDWSRIALACVALAIALQATRFLGTWPSAVLSLGLYAILVARLGLFPREALVAMLEARRARARRHGDDRGEHLR